MKTKSEYSYKTLNITFCVAFFLLLVYRLLYMANKPLLVEEAYYWNYAQHLDFSYLDHPPMVAMLIKFGTLVWGDTEWGIRFMTIPCWLLTMIFNYKLTQTIKAGAEKYTFIFLSFLPFFFIHSLIITPDIPLILSWSASLFYLYNAAVLNKPTHWYGAGIWLGIGLLSKYTIALLGIATLFYLLILPDARYWFTRKEPYLAMLIACLLFLPVIYWNSTHHWVSFLFQTSNRFGAFDRSSFHLFLGLIILFFTPVGVLETARLFFVSQKDATAEIPAKTKLFFLCYTFVPILFFAFFSLFHQIKFNWIGPSMLAIIPWFSISLKNNGRMLGLQTQTNWVITAFITMVMYSLLLFFVFFDWPQFISNKFPSLSLDWEKTSYEIYKKTFEINQQIQEKPIIVTLNKYNIASELIFYQKKLMKREQTPIFYPVLGASLFHLNSLMFKYWDNIMQANGKYLLLVSNHLYSFDFSQVHQITTPITPLTPLYKSEANNNGIQFYYQLVKMK